MRLAAVSGTLGCMSEWELARTAKAFTAEQKSARSTGKFCPAGAFFSLLRFFSSAGKKRNEDLLSSSVQSYENNRRHRRHPAKRDRINDALCIVEK